MRVFWQVYAVCVASLVTTIALMFVSFILQMLVLFGPVPLLVILGFFVAFLLAMMLVITLPLWIAWFALWASKDPSPRGATQRARPTSLASDRPVAGEDAQSVFEGLRLAIVLVYLFIYAALVTGMLALFFQFFQHTVPGYMPEVVVYATFGAEVAFFAALLARVLIKRRYAASMPA